MTAFGASRPLPYVPAKVSFLITQRELVFMPDTGTLAGRIACRPGSGWDHATHHAEHHGK